MPVNTPTEGFVGMKLKLLVALRKERIPVVRTAEKVLNLRGLQMNVNWGHGSLSKNQHRDEDVLYAGAAVLAIGLLLSFFHVSPSDLGNSPEASFVTVLWFLHLSGILLDLERYI